MTEGRSADRPDVAALLSGLVSDEAAAVFERLQDGEGEPIGSGPGHLDMSADPARELAEAGVLNVQIRDGVRIVRTVPLGIASRRLLDRQHRRLTRMQEQLESTWLRFSEMTSFLVGRPDDGEVVAEAQVITDFAEIRRLASGLSRAPKRLLRSVVNGVYPGGPTKHGLILPPADAIASGAQFRAIYEAGALADEWSARSVRLAVEAGEQAKVRAHVPVKMVHVDDSVALVTVDATGQAGALYVHSPALLTVLAEWFDLLWADPRSTVVSGSDPAGLTPVQQRILQLMAAGLTDDAVAQRTGLAVRTVRRHIGSVLTVLQVESRFAAGVAAVRRGWL